ncbi:hypothetical protein LZ578_02185 [Jeotgalibaca sp. MA1X17-3]|uniref:FGGY family carbohydrate kinase n=1 Tax=Jeotgalibaca sp. MA1X17-3 TaxID=2908211 RepID=UPI001EFEF998|nr:FGGY family carbohydrate kinase [Jeotgalibaca sp. MA1X17-3]UJF15976.1 hypothetical protein LZ578_02185 [Jeotgalibaca sp. MA1X17-3]
MTKYIASIDVGTTNLKINLFNSSYEVIDTVKFTHTDIIFTDTRFEMKIDEIWQNMIGGLRQLIDKNTITDIEIVLTTAMHSVQLMTNDFSLSGPLLAWTDKRGTEVIESMSQEKANDQYLRTGTPIHSMNPFFKLVHLREQLGSLTRIGSLKDILFYRLTGEWAIDVSNASSSGLYNLSELNWDQESLQSLGISTKQLPKIQPISYSSMTLPGLLHEQATVYIGTSDGISSNFVFNDLEDIAVLSLGTSHAVRVIHEKIQCNVDFQNFSYIIHPNAYLIGLPSNNGANILAWAIKIFNSSFDELNSVLLNPPEVNTIFLPFINGERAPVWDDTAMGHLFNLTRTNTRESILYAIILGMIFNMKQNVERLAELVDFKAIGLVGGGARLEALPQLMADILGYKLFIPTMKNAETLGSIAAVKNEVFQSEYLIVEPNPHRTYEKAYKSYQNKLLKTD